MSGVIKGTAEFDGVEFSYDEYNAINDEGEDEGDLYFSNAVNSLENIVELKKIFILDETTEEEYLTVSGSII